MTLEPADQRDLDRIAVAAQLGRQPRGLWSVARRCGCGKPQVIETHPRLEDGTPFPTLWWLTCLTLAAQVGRLESSGLMADLNQRLAWDDSFRAALRASTEAYIERRDELDALGQSTHPGGGPDHIKCLHAHTAHHLISGDNPAGKKVLSVLGWVDPKEPCV